jgi:hypothetical protein
MTLLVKEVLCAQNTAGTLLVKKKSSASSTISAPILPQNIRKLDRRSKEKLKYEVDTKKEEPCQVQPRKLVTLTF